MASPFKIFRKNAKVLLVALFLLSMISFVVIPAFLQWLQTQQTRVVRSIVRTKKFGELTEEHLHQLAQEHATVRRFLEVLARRIAELQGDFRQVQMLLQMVGRPNEEQLVQTWLLSSYARSAGMEISDRTVNSFLRTLIKNSGVSISDTDLQQLLASQRIEEGPLFSGLARQLLVLNYLQMSGFDPMRLAPETPGMHWEYFLRFNRMASVELCTLPLDRYVERAPAPTEQQIREFFEKHKMQLPDPNSPEPGFKVPTKVTLEYVKGDLQKWRLNLKISDEELRQFYETRKDELFVRPAATPPNGLAQPLQQSGGQQPGMPAAETSQPEATPEPAPRSDLPKESQTPTEGQQAASPSAGVAPTEKPQQPTEQTQPPPAADEKPNAATKPQDAAPPSSGTSPAPSADVPNTPPTSSEQAPPTPQGSQSQNLDRARGVKAELVSYREEQDQEKKNEEAAQEKTGGETAENEAAGKMEDNTEQKTEDKPAQEAHAKEQASQPEGQKPAQAEQAGQPEEKPQATPAEAPQQKATEEAAPQPEPPKEMLPQPAANGGESAGTSPPDQGPKDAAQGQPPSAKTDQPGAQQAGSGTEEKKPEAQPSAEAAQAPAQMAAPEGKPATPEQGQQAPVPGAGQSAPPPSEQPPMAPPAAAAPVPPATAEGAAAEKTATPATEQPAQPAETSKYLPFEEVKERVRDLIISERIKAALDSIEEVMRQYQTDWVNYQTDKEAAEKAKRTPPPPPAQPDIRRLAKEKGLDYGRIDEAASWDLEKADIGKSFDFQSTPFIRSVLDLREYFTIRSLDFEQNQYLAWVLARTEEHVPTLDEPGVRDQVIQAWRRAEARKLAEQELTRLAQQVNTERLSLIDFRGKHPELKLPEVVQTEPFTWLTYGEFDLARMTRPQARISPVKIRFKEATSGLVVEKDVADDLGNDFMATVFALDVGETGFAWNRSHTTAYLVRVVEYQPPYEQLREMFVRQNPEYYLPGGQIEVNQIVMRWIRSLEEDAGLQWNREPVRATRE